MGKTRSKPRTVEERLREAGIQFDKLDDVPPRVIREVNRRKFPDMRSIELPANLIRKSLQEPLLRDLLITRIGYSSRSAGHYIPRPEGSLDHILIYCTQGAGWLRMGGRQWNNIGPDTMLCIPAHEPHWYGADSGDPWSIYWIHLTGRQASEFFDFLDVTVDAPLIHLSQRSELLSVFEEAYAWMKAVHTRDNLIQGAISLGRFLGAACRLQHAADPRSRGLEEAVRGSIEFMTQNLVADVSLTELAQLARMSVSRYTLAFRKNTGCSPMEYVNRLRIQRACELLRNSDSSVQSIALQVGFNDPYYFSRAFKKVVGIAPLQFRKKGGLGRKAES